MTGNDKQQNPLLVASVLILAAALSALNWPHVFLDPLPLWYRIGGETLLVAGLLGRIMRKRSLRVAGWIGILLFAVYALIGSMPILNNPALAASGQQPSLWITRFVFSLVLCVALVLCFKRLAPQSQQRPASADKQKAPATE